MNAKTDDTVIEALDRLDRMNFDAARGVRDLTALHQDHYSGAGENATHITVIHAGDGIVVITDRYGLPDIAWSGHLDDQEILDDLVESGHLSRDE